MTQPSRRLCQLGMLLFLGALLIGIAIPALAVPRLGVAAHLNGLLGALFLVVLGLIWPHLRLGPNASGLAFWLASYSFFMATLMPLLGAMWRAGGSMFPIAAGTARGTAFQESVIAAGLITSAVAVIVLSVLLVLGLRGRAGQP